MFRLTSLLSVMTPRAALKLLALSPTTGLTQKAIKKAYIKRTLECHPDLHPSDPGATERFRDLSEALHVALQALELTQPSSPSREPSDDFYDPQKSIEALRQAIIAYHSFRDAEDGSTPKKDSSADAFFSPSLEYISGVCRREDMARRRVHIFCEDLPNVLSGGGSSSLFEAVAFFHTRYVESMSICVMRFSKNLPLIVRRVVKNRKRHISYRRDPVTSGMGTGSRPREQRIEDMTMKPLVLMGALIFDLPEQESLENPLLRGVSGSTCGVSSPKKIQVTEELKCTIFPSDSIGVIVDKISAWEAASFDRLKIELAIVDVTTLMSNLLGFDRNENIDDNHVFNVVPHLQIGKEQIKKVLMTLQALSANLCFHFEEIDAVDEELDKQLEQLISANDDESKKDAEQSIQLSIPQLVQHSKKLYKLAFPSIKGNINIHWTDESRLVQSETQIGDSKNHSEEKGREYSIQQMEKSCRVSRHPKCCTAEEVLYSVSVEVDEDVHRFLLCVRHALKTVAQQAFRSRKKLNELIELREKTIEEEFILLPGQEDVDEEHRKYRFRGTIQCFPRLYNISTSEELLFWERVYANREYLAEHTPAMNHFNIFFNCMVYNGESNRDAALPQPPTDIVAGWVGDGSEDCDDVILTSEVLKEDHTFKQWLEEIVEQSTLNKEAQNTLFGAGIGYISRDPALPLTNFLSFVKIFSSASAVRSVIEKGSSSNRIVDSSDTGLNIIVGTKCDVSDGGRLFIPWYLDPNTLLALLGERDAPAELDL